MAVELGRQTEASAVTQPNKDSETAAPVGSQSIWEDIEVAESYLVCSMFKEAESSASSVLKRLHDKESDNEFVEDIELNDMLESAGMVFVQSLKELGRTLEIINELTQLYESLAAIPVQVFLAGACFHMQEDPRGAKNILEEFLSKWRFVNEQYYILETSDTNNNSNIKESGNRFVVEVETYIQIVEAYVTLLTVILRETDLAISWVEKAPLPEQNRQEFLRRLQSMNSSKNMGTRASTSALLKDENINSSISLKNGSSNNDGDDAAKQAILKYSKNNIPTFWWFRTINLKLGNVQFAVSNGSVLLTAFVLLAYYYMRRKKYTITSILKGQVAFVKKAIVDVWQLAFSYQVNPLAAVEPLQNPARVSR